MHRVLLISDMHYTTEETPAEMKQIDPTVNTSVAAGDAFGHTQKEKIDLLREAILAEHEKAPLDGVLVLGDLSIDDYDYRNLPDHYCRRFREEVMDRLPCPAWALAGNHDSYPDEAWREVFGYGRQFARGGKVKYDLEETEDGWHYFGMDWREDGYTFYCDGKEVMQCTDHVSHVPQFILLTTEVQGYRSGLKGNEEGKYKLLGGGGLVDEPPFKIKDQFVDDAFICDFVRVFDRVED